MADNYERLVRWYLRFNGYFTIENFYVHNPEKVMREHVGDDTEADIIGIRMPYSSETAGSVAIGNHEPLVAGAGRRHDVVIAEVKNAHDARPNPVWRHPEDPGALEAIEYIVRFIGVRSEKWIRKISRRLATDFAYRDHRLRIRYIMFCNSLSKGFRGRVQHFGFDEIVRFLDQQRGQCWRRHGLGVASTHKEWEPLINAAFRIFNGDASPLERQESVLRLLAEYIIPGPRNASAAAEG